MNNNEDLNGLRGWLILVGIGVVLSPINSLVIGVEMCFQLIESGSWEAMTSVNSKSFTPYWGELVIGEIIFNVLMVLVSIYIAYLFFTKHFLFPKLFIIFSVISLMAIPLDAWLITKVLPDVEFFRTEATDEFIRAFMYCSIWIPYMLVSKRVKVTFLEKIPNKEMQSTTECAS